MVVDILRQRNFLLLFLGQATSTIGDRIVYVALALYVTDIGSPTDVGLVLAAATFPLVAFLLFGGVWADRLPRHKVMIVTDLARFALHALLAALIFTDAIEIWHLVVIEALFGTAEAFFRPAYTGLVPQTVPEDRIQDAKAATGALETVAEFAGPALATALVLGLGAGWAFALDALTFLVSAAFLLGVRPRERGKVEERRAAARAARGLGRGAHARVGVGDARRLLARAPALLRAVHDARADGRRGGVRLHRRLRPAGRGHGRRHDGRRAARVPAAAAASDARRDDRGVSWPAVTSASRSG